MNITKSQWEEAAKELNCEVAAIKAVALVESRGGGFNPNGTPKILFEGHYFSKFTNRKYDESHPFISYRRWTREFYGNQENEHMRLDIAQNLNREAALKSASWGAFQIMGANYKACGCSSVQDFVNEIYHGEYSQLKLFLNFIKFKGLVDELQNLDWENFAYYYNGPRFRVNKYDEKMERYYLKFKNKNHG